MFVAFDCEGPLTLNDNAFEYCKFKIPKGDYFFKQISRFDDYLADIKKLSGYKAGDTLKLILPFLKVFGATNEELKEFSKKTIIFLPGAKELLNNLSKVVPVFIISTSYKPYLEALCEVTGFDMDRVFCTELDFNLVEVPETEKKEILSYYEEIIKLPEIELPSEAESTTDLSSELLKVLDRLEEIFFEKIWNMEVGKFLRSVNPIGGKEKALSCKKIAESLNTDFKNSMYVGDSITDVQALELVREGGGVSVSFNGNRYALKAAEFYAFAKSPLIFTKVWDEFLKKGKDALVFLSIDEGEFGKVPESDEEFKKLVEKSQNFRKKVRGEVIGDLG